MMTLWEFFIANPAGTTLQFLLVLLGYVLVALPLIAAVLLIFHVLLTLPMRRNERARLFLDLLELGLKDGQTPEVAVVQAASTRDRAMGVRFHLLAAHIQKGLRFSAALDRVPRLLPPQVRAMLSAGERIGDMTKVLPACRQLLRDGVSQVRGALNYLVLLAFSVTPFTLFVPLFLNFLVMPRFKEIFSSMGVEKFPAFSAAVFSNSPYYISLQCFLLFFIWLALIAYLGGPRLRGWLRSFAPTAVDGFLWEFPWRRKRLQRDFSTILAALLDSGVPEGDAVTLAAESTVNNVVIARAAKIRGLLAQGQSLPDALRAFDDTGEFQWRLANALRGRGGFLRALKGWHEALDAKAFQLEQSAAQLATAGFVLLNGLIVACIVIGVFLALITIINQVALW